MNQYESVSVAKLVEVLFILSVPSLIGGDDVFVYYPHWPRFYIKLTINWCQSTSQSY
jgi:hypothetical protein